jgi:ABC-type transport system involved in cytochrome c biogenesis permease subunit
MFMLDEITFLYTACVCYGLSFVLTYLGREYFQYRSLLFFSIVGLLAHSINLALRWDRVGHGPFINLYEILSSNLWSLLLAYLLFLIWAREHRPAGRYIVPLLALLMFWLLISEPQDTYLPATYNTIWLYFHVVSGKFFLGLLMLATGVAILEMSRAKSTKEPGIILVSKSLSYRLLAFAFCFESLMLMFGAIWAQDAWGRYWAWDPLETWAFLTWMSVIFVLHWRLNYSRQGIYAALVVGCFTLAFLTFFGVPLISTAPHKGMI